MTAVQVRDFPDELYAELKEFAKKEHRSASQQIIAFVEQGIDNTRRRRQTSLEEGSSLTRIKSNNSTGLDDEAFARRKRKEALLKEILASPIQEYPPGMPSPVELIREDRDSR